MSSAIVVQCFVKQDTLAGLLASLLLCERTREFHLFLWSDVPPVGPKAERYRAQNEVVRAQIEAFASAHREAFASITVIANDRNRGTAGTCQAALDHAFALHDFVIFTEDDTVFSRDALDWFSTLRASGALEDPSTIGLAGESIYFDARHNTLPLWYPAQARRLASRRRLTEEYVKLKFLPSTCFATTRAKWAEFGAIRGRPRGAEEVCVLCREQSLVAIFPVVARVKDIGMLHESGYSVGIHGAAGVREIKNTYLVADDLPPRSGPPRPYTGNVDQLFQDSTKLTGFKTPPARPPARPWRVWAPGGDDAGVGLTSLVLRHFGVPFEPVSRIEDANLLGIGGRLEQVAPRGGTLVVWGAGYHQPPDRPISFGPQIRFLALRGYLTEALVGPASQTDLVIGDGALLAGRLLNADKIAKMHDLGVVGDQADLAAAKAAGLGNWAGVRLIDIATPTEELLRDVAGCRRIAASHALGNVLADAFGIPHIRLTAQPGADFAADDHASALGYEITTIAWDERNTREGLLGAIDLAPAHGPVPQATLDDLTMTVQLLRGCARGLCDV
jgi:hypothetical protein